VIAAERLMSGPETLPRQIHYIDGAGSKATGNWRVNNSPTIKRVAKRQQTKQKSKCQLAAQGYNNARTINYYHDN
jgi:hypothetical protein